MKTVKGSILISYRAWVTETQGEEVYQKFMAAFTRVDRDILCTPALISGGKYPVEMQFRYLELAEQYFGAGTAVKLGRAVADRDLRGVHKVLLKISSVETTLSLIVKAWSFYYDGGRAHVAERGDKGWVLVAEDENMTRLLVDAIAGYVGRAAELSGGHNVRVRQEAQPQAHVYRFSIKWD